MNKQQQCDEVGTLYANTTIETEAGHEADNAQDDVAVVYAKPMKRNKSNAH